MSATRAQSIELPCGFADPTGDAGDGIFGECHVDVMAGHFMFRLASVGAR
jgi:hypothetical protein